MKRQIVYPGAIPLETDILNTQKNSFIALAKLAAGVLGTSTLVNGLSVVPTGPASLQVVVNPGEIYSLVNVDTTAYSSLPADTTHNILKQGILLDAVNLTITPPGTAGQSINYLVQVQFTEVDGGATVLPYYNASNPAVAYSGPNNAGTSQNTYRDGQITIQLKAGTAAPTGSQTTPAADAGFTGIYVVTVANGQTTIVAGNISIAPSAPLLTETLTQKLSQTTADARYASQVGFQGNIYSVSAAGGTADAITGTYSPAITALTNGMTLNVRTSSANATTTPTFTPNSGTVPAKTIVKGAGAALTAGDIAGGGHWIELQYDLTLDKWVLLNPATGVAIASMASVQGAFKNLQASATGTNATVTISADEIVVEDTSNNYKTLRAVSLSINSAASGANGLDTGSLAASTWYSDWVIYNPTTQTTAGLLSLSSTAPTMPSGYTMKARVGWIRTDGTANKYPLSFKQYARSVQYVIGAATNVTAYPILASGTQGTYSTTTFTGTAVAVGNFVPPTASKIRLTLIAYASGSIVGAAPSQNFGGYNTTSNPPLSSNGPATPNTSVSDFVLESSNVYYASNGASSALSAVGWEDNL